MKHTQFKKILKQIFGIRVRIVTKRRRRGKRLEYLKYKEKARVIALDRCKYFGKIYNLKYNRISIRNQKTRWGSCSKGGNLNFSYKIALLPANLVDYIIAHEICHLSQFNHSLNFWNLLAQTIPDHKELRMELNKVGMTLG